jgi:hypothetical protein
MFLLSDSFLDRCICFLAVLPWEIDSALIHHTKEIPRDKLVANHREIHQRERLEGSLASSMPNMCGYASISRYSLEVGVETHAS